MRSSTYVGLTLLVLLLSAYGETADEAATSWVYSEEQDEMGRGAVHFASVDSLNTVHFSFPHEGEHHMRLMLRKGGKFDGDAILRIDGQFLPNSHITVRFDSGKLQQFGLNPTADYDLSAGFIGGYHEFVRQLRGARNIKIEADFYHEGAHVFEFDIHGLTGHW